AVGGRGSYGEATTGQLRDLRAGGWSKPLGQPHPDVVVGDPADPAVIIADPVGLPVAVGSSFRQPDRRVEYVTNANQRRTLITDRQAGRVLHLSGRVELLPWSAPGGCRIAVRFRVLAGSGGGLC